MTDVQQRLQREVRLLRIHVIIGSMVLGTLCLVAFRHPSAPTTFEEIDVQRINVREANGTLRMVLANRGRSPGAVVHGKEISPAGERPGIIFFNDEETENGGLVFEGRTNASGRVAGAQLSFDQYDQDQVITLAYDEQGGRRTMGLNVIDRPELPTGWHLSADSIRRMPDGPAKAAAFQRLMAPASGAPASAPRAFVGRDGAGTAIVRLSDPHGRTRLRLLVDSLGAARIEFLDARGRVTQQVPAASDTLRK